MVFFRDEWDRFAAAWQAINGSAKQAEATL
jgi:hypothetical protein